MNGCTKWWCSANKKVKVNARKRIWKRAITYCNSNNSIQTITFPRDIKSLLNAFVVFIKQYIHSNIVYYLSDSYSFIYVVFPFIPGESSRWMPTHYCKIKVIHWTSCRVQSDARLHDLWIKEAYMYMCVHLNKLRLCLSVVADVFSGIIN